MLLSFRINFLFILIIIATTFSFAQEKTIQKNDKIQEEINSSNNNIEETQAAGDNIQFKDGTSILMEIKSTGSGFGGQIFLPSIQSSSNPKVLYNYNGNLFWGADQVALSGSVGSDNDWTISGNNIYNNNSANVGIGATNPISKLSVGSNGNALDVIHAQTTLTNGRAVYGYATNNTSGAQNYGGYFRASGSLGRGVFGYANGIDSRGVYGNNAGSNGIGVFGNTTGGTGSGVRGTAENTGNSMNYGGHFEASGQLGRGVYGYASNNLGQNFGGYFVANGAEGAAVYADGGSTTYAGFFSGNVNITGNLTVQGTFPIPASAFSKIDHPLDPTNKNLYHSFVESPEMMNVYNGNVTLDANGEATVTMADWFEALNKDFRYQLTCIGGFAPIYIAEKINGNQFEIAGGSNGMEVSWQVTGVRQDAYANAKRVKVEEMKKPEERGKYLNPTAFGQPEEMGISYSESMKGQEQIIKN